MSPTKYYFKVIQHVVRFNFISLVKYEIKRIIMHEKAVGMKKRPKKKSEQYTDNRQNKDADVNDSQNSQKSQIFQIFFFVNEVSIKSNIYFCRYFYLLLQIFFFMKTKHTYFFYKEAKFIITCAKFIIPKKYTIKFDHGLSQNFDLCSVTIFSIKNKIRKSIILVYIIYSKFTSYL